MKRLIAISGMILMVIAVAAWGADNLSDETLRYDQPPGERYRANEFSLDLFGGTTVSEPSVDRVSGARTVSTSRSGAGAGLNYFFSRNIGIGAEGFTENTTHSIVDNASGSLIVRWPFGRSGMAAYAFGGGGHQFDPLAGTSFHTGAGLEYRFNSHVGLFFEPRIVFRSKISNYGFGRFGVRVVF